MRVEAKNNTTWYLDVPQRLNLEDVDEYFGVKKLKTNRKNQSSFLRIMNVGSPEIKLWFKMNEEAISCSQNHKDIERILRKNLEFKNIKETNFLDFFSKTATNLNELASIKIDEVNTFYEGNIGSYYDVSL